jgi:hypothetical protein
VTAGVHGRGGAVVPRTTSFGPSFVDATNIDKIAGFAANNTR